MERIKKTRRKVNKLDDAVLGGELDTQIEQASELARARFKK